MKACTEWEYKVASTEPSESRLLIKGRADMSAALVDDFESVQVKRILLPYEINDRNCFRTQDAQEIVIISARGAPGRLGADGSLKKKKCGEVRNYSRPRALASSVQDSPLSSAPENVTGCGIEALR
jgi:hypothetical protein